MIRVGWVTETTCIFLFGLRGGPFDFFLGGGGAKIGLCKNFFLTG